MMPACPLILLPSPQHPNQVEHRRNGGHHDGGRGYPGCVPVDASARGVRVHPHHAGPHRRSAQEQYSGGPGSQGARRST